MNVGNQKDIAKKFWNFDFYIKLKFQTVLSFKSK